MWVGSGFLHAHTLLLASPLTLPRHPALAAGQQALLLREQQLLWEAVRSRSRSPAVFSRQEKPSLLVRVIPERRDPRCPQNLPRVC